MYGGNLSFVLNELENKMLISVQNIGLTLHHGPTCLQFVLNVVIRRPCYKAWDNKSFYAVYKAMFLYSAWAF